MEIENQTTELTPEETTPVETTSEETTSESKYELWQDVAQSITFIVMMVVAAFFLWITSLGGETAEVATASMLVITLISRFVFFPFVQKIVDKHFAGKQYSNYFLYIQPKTKKRIVQIGIILVTLIDLIYTLKWDFESALIVFIPMIIIDVIVISILTKGSELVITPETPESRAAKEVRKKEKEIARQCHNCVHFSKCGQYRPNCNAFHPR